MRQGTLTLISLSPEDTRALGRTLGEVLSGGEAILLGGPLGVGKTVLVQGIGLGIGYEGRVTSPSFVLERVHQGRLTLRHLDLYRLSGDEAMEAGLLEEPDSKTVMVVEWAERAEGLLRWTIKINMEFVPSSPEERRISIEASNTKWGEKAKDVVSRFHERRADSAGPGD